MKESPPLLLWLLFFTVASVCANAPLKIALLSSEHDDFVPLLRQDSVELVHKVVPRTLDPFVIRKAACKAIDEGVAGIVDATTDGGFVSQTVRSVCDSVGVPCVSVNSHGRHDNVYSVRLHPSRDYVAKVLKDVLKAIDWTSLTYVYDSVDNLALSEGFLNDPSFTVKVARIANDSEIRRVLESVEQSGYTSTVLALNSHHLRKILNQIADSGLNSSSHKFLVTSLDANLPSLKEFSATSDSRIAVLKIADEATFYSRDSLQLQQLLVDDALSTISAAFKNSSLSPDIAFPNGLCDNNGYWSDGQHLLNAIKQVELLGSTGPIAFNPEGEREGVHFGLLQLVKGEPKALLNWTPNKAVTHSHWAQQIHATNKVKRQVPTLRVHAILSEPYVMRKEDPEAPVSGRDSLEGLSVDILDEIAAEIGFDYTIDVLKDNVYGSKDATGQWNGLIGSIANRRADVIIGDVTVSKQRETVVSFTKPWLFFGVGLIAARQDSIVSVGDLFTFLWPFSLTLWITLLIVYLAITVIFFLIARLSPIERTRPVREETESWSPYTLLHSGWFIISALLRQTPVQQPRSLSVRILSGFWWLFTVIVVAYYFANLVHIIQVNNSENEQPIQSVYDLVNQHKIKYGAVYEGTTWRYFKNSQMPIHQQIYAGLEMSRNSVYKPKNQMEAVEMVRESNGQYAFFLEQPTLEYMTERQCDLKSIGGIIGPNRHFAIGLTRGSPYVQRFNDAILSLKESGVLDVLYKKWMNIERGGGQCDDVGDDTMYEAPQEIDVEDLAGPLIVLAIGVGVAFLIAVCECCCRASFIAKQKGDPLCGEVANQLKLAVKGPPVVTPNIVVNQSAD